MIIILNFGFFKLSDIDQGVHQHSIQKKKEFSAFLKKKIKWKESKSQFYRIQNYVMHTKY